jgi:hypothetical protein
MKDLIVRGSYRCEFRAPRIGELFGSKARFVQLLAERLNGTTYDVPGSSGYLAATYHLQ